MFFCIKSFSRENIEVYHTKKGATNVKKDEKTAKKQQKTIEQRRDDRTKFPPTDYLPREERIITDPLGSWTGIPADNALDKPIQDADDL